MVSRTCRWMIGMGMAAVLVTGGSRLASAADETLADWLALTTSLYGPSPVARPSLLGVDLSLSAPLESTVKVPLAPPAGRRLQPYVSARVSDPTRDVDESSVLSRWDVEAGRRSQRVDVGAGLNWQVRENVEIFGEFGLLRRRLTSDSLLGIEPGRRDTDAPYLKGGFTIRIP